MTLAVGKARAAISGSSKDSKIIEIQIKKWLLIFIGLIKGIQKLNLCLNISVLINLQMYYSETKVIMGGLAHVPILIFLVNFIKGKFESIASKVVEVKTEEPKVKVVEVEKEELKAEELNDSEVKEEAE